MRVRKYQGGGNINDLLRMLEQQEVQKESQKRLPPAFPMDTEPASALSTGVSMRPVKSLEDANMDASLSGMRTLHGRDYEPFDPSKTQGINPVYPLGELTGAGDIKGILESIKEERFGEAALIAGLALTPIPVDTVKRLYNSIGSFVRPSNMDLAENIIDIIKFRGDPADLLKTSGISGDIFNMSQEARSKLAEDLRALGETEIYDNAEIGQKIIDAGDAIESYSKSMPRQDLPESIGSFKKEMTQEDVAQGIVMRYTTEDGGFMELRKFNDPFGDYEEVYEMDIFARPSDGPSIEAGKLLKTAIQEVPKGGIMSFEGSLSTDSYPLVMKYVESGKASIVDSKNLMSLNASGKNPVLFSRTFNVDKQDVLDMFDADPMKQRAAYSRSKEAIDEKLKSFGLPKSQFDPFQGILMPHPVIRKEIPVGTYYMGGSLRASKKKKYVRVT